MIGGPWAPGGSRVKNPSAMQVLQETWVQFLGREDPWLGKVPWRRERLLTPVFLPRESHGQRSLAGYSPWGRKESFTTEVLSTNPGGP